MTSESSVRPTVTVAIPTHNRAKSIGNAIQSVLDQTFTDLELLVLDDASTDETAAVYASFDDPRLRYLKNPTNIGMTANWNRGFELARAPYVSLLHDDDTWSPGFLERTVRMFREHPEAGIVHCASGSLLGLPKADRLYTPEEALDRLRRRNEVPTEGVVVRRDAWEEAGGFRDRWPYTMDWELWLKIAARHPVGYVAEVLGHEGYEAEDRFTRQTHETALAIAKDKLGMLRETIPSLPIADNKRKRLLRLAMRSLAQTQLVTAWDCAASGERERAREEARFAMRIDPRVMLRAPFLVTATFFGSYMPSWLVRLLNRLRPAVRPLFRPD